MKRAAFTLIELLIVIAIIAVLASLTVGLAGRATQKAKLDRVRGVLNELTTAIEAYKQKKGFYPPSNPANTVTNTLFYELVGTVYDLEDDKFDTLNELEEIPKAALPTFFGVDGFVNSTTNTAALNNPDVRTFRDSDVQNFYPTLKTSRYREISGPQMGGGPDVEVLVVPVDWPMSNRFPPPFSFDPKVRTINPWRYNSASPVHNPQTYDLWAEVVIGGKLHTIGNWKD